MPMLGCWKGVWEQPQGPPPGPRAPPPACPPPQGRSATGGIGGTMGLIQPPWVLGVKARRPRAGQVLLPFFCTQTKPCTKEEAGFKKYF